MIRNEWLEDNGGKASEWKRSPNDRLMDAWKQWNAWDGSGENQGATLYDELHNMATMIAEMCQQVTDGQQATVAAQDAFATAKQYDGTENAFNHFTTVILNSLRRQVMAARANRPKWSMKRIHKNTLTRGLRK